jgi:hypothetical protein
VNPRAPNGRAEHAKRGGQARDSVLSFSAGAGLLLGRRDVMSRRWEPSRDESGFRAHGSNQRFHGLLRHTGLRALRHQASPASVRRQQRFSLLRGGGSSRQRHWPANRAGDGRSAGSTRSNGRRARTPGAGADAPRGNVRRAPDRRAAGRAASRPGAHRRARAGRAGGARGPAPLRRRRGGARADRGAAGGEAADACGRLAPRPPGVLAGG